MSLRCCSNCGQELSNDETSCPHCGANARVHSLSERFGEDYERGASELGVSVETYKRVLRLEREIEEKDEITRVSSQTSKSSPVYCKQTLRVNAPHTSSSNQTRGSNSSGLLIRIGSIVLAFLILIMLASMEQCTYNLKPAKEFSVSLKDGTKAYVDIVTIEPMYSIHTKGSTFVYSIICKCTTNKNSTVWVRMTENEYQKYIDPEASFEYYFSEYKTVYLSKPIRIQGKVWDSDDVAEDLYKKIGQSTLIFFEDIVE